MSTAPDAADPAADVRVAVVGCGYWGVNLVRNFGELGALAAVVDDDPRAAQRASELGGAPARSWAQVLQDPDIAAVAVAAPAAAHARLAGEALRAGKHVFVEKPLALDIGEAEELRDLADKECLTLMVGHLLRYHPAFERLQQLVHAGELGQIRYLYSNRLNFGKFRREENILWSFAPHDISMILALVGAEPHRVEAVGSMYLHREIADVTTTHLSFPSGEAAHVFVSWLHPYKEQRLVVVGDRGMAVFDDGEGWDSKLRRFGHEVAWRNGMPEPSRGEGENVAVVADEPLARECRHFLHCVRTGEVPLTDAGEGLRVLRVLDAAQRAMEMGAARTLTELGAAPSSVHVHPTAVIDDDVVIGAGTRVWHFSHLLPGTRLGRNCVVGQNVMIGPDVDVGDGCKIQNNVSLYKGVRLEANVFCGPSAVFTNVLTPRASIERKDDFKPTRVGTGASIGANATIVCGNDIGAFSMVAAGAVVTSDVAAHALVMGVPARRVGWVSHSGARLRDDLVCPETGRRYRVAGESLEEITE